MPASRPIRVLVPFLGDWEVETLHELERSGDIVACREGFDLRRFPGCTQLMWFDAPRFVDRMVRRYRGRVDAVWSCDEQFGCLIAAVIARRLGLPGTDPLAVVTAQHKLLMRRTLAEKLPHASVRAAAVPYRLSDRRSRDAAAIAAVAAQHGLEWPLFAKPVKATFSVLARRAAAAEVLAEHLRVSAFDRYVMGRMTRPFESLAGRIATLPTPADALLLEEPLCGHQVNV
ncbi:MAG: hypothetical protein KDC98_13465, partial [Planctomycetes bacterium]|nr:hypothetical protein [Planctomycetota bacterium]